MFKIVPNSKPQPQFWIDEPEVQVGSLRSFKFLVLWVKISGILILIMCTVLIISLLFYLSHFLGWFYLGFMMIAMGIGLYNRRRIKQSLQGTGSIQQNAQTTTGASLIGSAIHVAGHPLLNREQSVVLALISSNLAIYSYETDQPLAVIPLQQIQSIQTVTYDDERVPHIEVVDSTAQAIQLILKFGDQEIACLFRRMRKVRPIDWYHAVQKARISM
jgi:hypothetical protein